MFEDYLIIMERFECPVTRRVKLVGAQLLVQPARLDRFKD
jgi:hypothetical protein